MKKKKDIYIFGAGGLAREIYLLLQELPEYKFLAFIDKECQRNEVIKCNGQLLPVISESVFDESIEKNNNINAVLPIGFPKLLCKIKNKYCDKCNFPNIIHPSVKLNNGFKIGKGNIISANNVFTDNVRVGSFNVFNIGSLVGHDVTFGDCNVINSSCNISGNVTIGSYNLIGVRSVILQGKSIGDHNIVGAGSVLIRKLTDNTTVFGVPAIKI